MDCKTCIWDISRVLRSNLIYLYGLYFTEEIYIIARRYIRNWIVALNFKSKWKIYDIWVYFEIALESTCHVLLSCVYMKIAWAVLLSHFVDVVKKTTTTIHSRSWIKTHSGCQNFTYIQKSWETHARALRITRVEENSLKRLNFVCFYATIT